MRLTLTMRIYSCKYRHYGTLTILRFSSNLLEEIRTILIFIVSYESHIFKVTLNMLRHGGTGILLARVIFNQTNQ